jgi:hypothetical protein
MEVAGWDGCGILSQNYCALMHSFFSAQLG